MQYVSTVRNEISIETEQLFWFSVITTTSQKANKISPTYIVAIMDHIELELCTAYWNTKVKLLLKTGKKQIFLVRACI